MKNKIRAFLSDACAILAPVFLVLGICGVIVGLHTGSESTLAAGAVSLLTVFLTFFLAIVLEPNTYEE